jgi:hypothetical protein
MVYSTQYNIYVHLNSVFIFESGVKKKINGYASLFWREVIPEQLDLFLGLHVAINLPLPVLMQQHVFGGKHQPMSLN